MKLYLKSSFTVEDVMEKLKELDPNLKEIENLYHIKYYEDMESRVVILHKNDNLITFSIYATAAKELLKDMIRVE